MYEDKQIALIMLGDLTGQTCDIYKLSGGSWSTARQSLLKTLLGYKMPKAQCGVNRIVQEFAKAFSIARTTSYEVCRQLRYINDTENWKGKWTPERVMKHFPLVYVEGFGLANVTPPISIGKSKILLDRCTLVVTYGKHNEKISCTAQYIADVLNSDGVIEPINKDKK